MTDLRECDRSMYGHAFYKIDDDAQWRGNRVFHDRNVSRCERCGMVRVRGLNIWGQVERTYYYPPPGWKERWDGIGGERPSGDEMRRILLLSKRTSRKK